MRKTAALNVAKLYEHEIEVVQDNGFLERLREMLTDSTPMVSGYPHQRPALGALSHGPRAP